MPRRPSWKSETQIAEITSVETVATPKKGRRTVKTEEEVVAKSPANSTKKKVKAEAYAAEENIEEFNRSAGIKINRVKAKAVVEEELAPKSKKAPGKRKSKAVDENEDDEDAEDNKVAKKRKTKEEKEAEAMPLAARTAIGGLKKAMYIGAHVSAAGGRS